MANVMEFRPDGSTVVRDETDAERQGRIAIATQEAAVRTAAILQQRYGLRLLDKVEDNDTWLPQLKALWQQI